MTAGTVLMSLRSGVGNQLFQYAAGLQVAAELDATLYVQPAPGSGIGLLDLLPEGSVLRAGPEQWRRFRLSPEQRSLQRRLVDRAARAMPWHQRRVAHIRQVVGTDQHALAPRKGRIDAKDCFMSGWFIHRSWFGNTAPLVAEQVRTTLEVHPAFGLGRGATVISFRRGDYVRLGWDLDLSYYETALSRLGSDAGPLWLVGDDALFLEMARPWLAARGHDVRVVPDLGGSRALTDLAIIAGASGVVMSNSTFCWWGVTAGAARGRPDNADAGRARTGEPHRQKLVFVPEPWLPSANQSHEQAGLRHPDWQVVSTCFGQTIT